MRSSYAQNAHDMNGLPGTRARLSALRVRRERLLCADWVLPTRPKPVLHLYLCRRENELALEGGFSIGNLPSQQLPSSLSILFSRKLAETKHNHLRYQQCLHAIISTTLAGTRLSS